MKKSNILLLLAGFLLFSCGTRQASEKEISTIENSLRYSTQVKNDPIHFNLEERMRHYKVPGVSIAVVKDGQLHWAKGYGIANSETGTKVTKNTLFQAASISKPLAGLAVLKLAEEGKVNLDEDVNKYLKDWQLPQSEFTETEKVTVRRLLTHNGGLTISGFPGYENGEELPSTLAVLKGEGNTDAVVNDTIPGSEWSYSGGGYTVLQKMVEDVSGLPFEDYMQQNILGPMGMQASTFKQPLPEALHAKASAAYDTEGMIIKGNWHNYPEMAAAGLWTTPTDLARYEMEIQEILKGKQGLLSKDLVEKMLEKHKGDWGLGPQLRKEGDSLIFQHGGKNAGFTNMFMAPARGDYGLVVMTNGDNARPLMEEIITGISDYYGWNMAKTEEIEAVDLSQKQLQQFTGTYQLENNKEVSGKLLIEDGNLMVLKKGSSVPYRLVAVDSMKFVDPRTGNEFKFRKGEDEEVSAFLLSDQMLFLKAE